jgi:hypothetical protein
MGEGFRERHGYAFYPKVPLVFKRLLFLGLQFQQGQKTEIKQVIKWSRFSD